MSVRRIAAGAGAIALALTMLTPVGRVEVTETPVTASEVVEGLPSASQVRAASGTSGGARVTLASTAAASAAPAEAAVRSVKVEAPLTFSAVGFAMPDSATEFRVRTSEDGDDWTDWFMIDFVDALDGPDVGTAEAAAERDAARADDGGRLAHTEPMWVSEATHVQIEVTGTAPEEVTATFIDSMGHSNGEVKRSFDTRIGTAASASGLDLISRSQWGADESLGSSSVSTADEVHMGVVHHTAHAAPSVANSYSEAEAPGIVRAMYRYHTASLGWSDLGYNVVVDRFGNIYEGRKGGFDKGVIGAHARGYNTGSFGVSVIGNFEYAQASSAAIDALTKVIGLKSAIHGIDPTGATTSMADGTWRPTIVGHRDIGQTSCPGRIQELLPQIRRDAAEYSVRFPDVPTSSPHRTPILRLADAGVTTGCRTNAFCPTDGLERGQASSFVVRALELTPIQGTSFSDVDLNGAHTSSINVLVQNEWLLGRADGTFGPWEEMSREQLMTLLARALGLDLRRPTSDPYPDVSRDSVHAPAIAALKNVGVVGNCGGGNFCPRDVARRDSTASFVDMVRGLRGQ